MKAGIAQAIISEDSDLLVYGCQKVGVQLKTGLHRSCIVLVRLAISCFIIPVLVSWLVVDPLISPDQFICTKGINCSVDTLD